MGYLSFIGQYLPRTTT